jgi:hypothetical protein
VAGVARGRGPNLQARRLLVELDLHLLTVRTTSFLSSFSPEQHTNGAGQERCERLYRGRERPRVLIEEGDFWFRPISWIGPTSFTPAFPSTSESHLKLQFAGFAQGELCCSPQLPTTTKLRQRSAGLRGRPRVPRSALNLAAGGARTIGGGRTYDTGAEGVGPVAQENGFAVRVRG